MNKNRYEPRTLVVTSEPGQEIISRDGKADADPQAEKLAAPDVNETAVMPQEKPLSFDENPDPLRQRIHTKGAGHGGIWGILYRFLSPAPRQLTADEQAKFDENRRRREMEALLKRESILAMKRITNCLNQLNLCYRYPKSQQDWLSRGLQEVQFKKVLMQPEALYFQIDVNRLPRGIAMMQLADQPVLNQLSLSCEHRVICKYNEAIGFWYVIERASGIMGIPVHVDYQSMAETFPITADDLTIPLGMTTNSRRMYYSIKAMPHLLIAGATGAGKSNEVNVILGTLITRNSPDQLKLVMIDLKGGMELGFYEGIPHLWPVEGVTDTGIVTEQELVPPLLNELMEEAKRRMYTIERADHKDISRYNARRKGKNRLPRILLVIDEWANVRLGDHGAQAEKALANLTALGRAVGIHVIVATQVPSRQVISLLIKVNLPGKMCFSVPSYTASEVVINVGDAMGLAPQGRFIFQSGSETHQIQAPFMPDQSIRDIVLAVRRGERPVITQRHDVTHEELIRFALEKLEGRLNRNQLFTEFRPRGIRQAELESMLAQLEEQKTVELDDNQYTVIPSSGTSSRHLEIVTNEQKDNP